MMTIGDHPDYLALGYLLNQNMLRPGRRGDRGRARRGARGRGRAHRPITDFEAKLKKKVRPRAVRKAPRSAT